MNPASSSSSSERLWTRSFTLQFVVMLFAWAGHYMMVPTLPLFAVQRLSATPAQVGVLMGMMATSAIFSRGLAGYMTDRWGRRGLELIGLAINTVVAFSYGLMPSVAALLFWRLLHGVPFGAATMAGDTVAADLVPASRRGEVLGYFALAQTLAMVLGPAVALAVLGAVQFEKVFVVVGVLSGAAALLAWAVTCPPIRNPRLRFHLDAVLERRLVWLALTNAFLPVGYGGIMAFISLYAKELRIGSGSLFFSLYALGLFVTRGLTGRFFDRDGPRWVVGLGLSVWGLSFAVLALWRTPAGFFSAAFLAGFGHGAVHNTLRAMAINSVAAERRGVAGGMLHSAYDVGIALGSPLLGAVAQATGSYATMWLVVSALTVVNAAVFFALAMRSYKAVPISKL